MNAITTAARQPNLPEVIAAIESRRPQLASLLPADVPLESFISHFKTAAMRTEGLLQCTPKSVVLAIMQAANDGLMPDGREAAIIVYNRKDKQGHWHKEAQYQQMYLGILKRIRAAGEVVKIEARVVHAEDHFDYAYGDESYIVHKPAMKAEVGPVIAVYAIVTFRDGSKQCEVMSAHEVLAIRDRSKGFDPQKPNASPWGTDFGEMAKKTVLKRLGKILPQARGRAAISGDADDSGAEEEVDIYPELGTPEPKEPAPEAPAVDATSRTQLTPEQQKEFGAESAFRGTNERKIDGEKQGATEADEVVFWKAQLKKLRAALHVTTTLQGAEDAYNDWSAEYETIPDDVMVEVSRLSTRRVDQIKASLANNPTGPSDYQKMKDAE